MKVKSLQILKASNFLNRYLFFIPLGGKALKNYGKMIIALVGFWMIGCSTVNQGGTFFIESMFSDYQFHKDGFWIEGSQCKLEYNIKKNRETLKLKDDQLNTVILVDQGCDGKVDEIRLNYKSTYLRGDDRSKELFQMADQLFQKYRAGLGVPALKAKWKKLTPADVGGHNGLTNL